MTTPQRRLVVAFDRAPAHDLLRAQAAELHGVAESQIVLAHDCPRCGSTEHGQPRVLPTEAVPHPASVSLSRSGSWSLVAVSEAGPVGVDVEAERAAGFPGFDDVVLHPDERADGATSRTTVWVRKEAVLKACGIGLAVDPRSIRLEAGGLADWASPHPRPDVVWWRDLELPGYVAAVALLPPPNGTWSEPAVVVRRPSR